MLSGTSSASRGAVVNARRDRIISIVRMTDKATALNSLETTRTLWDRWTSVSRYMATTTGSAAGVQRDLEDLTGRNQVLQNRLARLQDVEATYDRESEDRMARGMHKPSVWQRWGLNTLQDWAMFSFFAAYVFLYVVLVLNIVTYSKTVLIGVTIATLAFGIFGVMLTALVIRFA